MGGRVKHRAAAGGNLATNGLVLAQTVLWGYIHTHGHQIDRHTCIHSDTQPAKQREIHDRSQTDTRTQRQTHTSHCTQPSRQNQRGCNNNNTHKRAACMGTQERRGDRDTHKGEAAATHRALHAAHVLKLRGGTTTAAQAPNQSQQWQQSSNTLSARATVRGKQTGREWGVRE